MNNYKRILIRPISDCSSLFFYQKANALFLLTDCFVKRYIHPTDRTKDQMIQAARSGKQNIIEGTADGTTSIEMEIQLLNVSRASIRELKEDYIDYLRIHGLPIWGVGHPRYSNMLFYCKTHNQSEDYIPIFPKMNDEELANLAITFSCQIDVLIHAYQTKIINGSSFDADRKVRLGIQ